jgi:hypothetical protein
VNVHALDDLMVREKTIAALITQAAGNDGHLYASLAQGESEVREQHTGRRVVWMKIAVEKHDTHWRRLGSLTRMSPDLG